MLLKLSFRKLMMRTMQNRNCKVIGKDNGHIRNLRIERFNGYQ